MKSYTDGACRVSNPGVCSCAFVLYNDKGQELHYESTYLGPELHTNNYAEYQGLLRCLRFLHSHETKNVDIYCDSALIVNQSLGNWKINREELKPFAVEAFGLITVGGHRLHHVKGHYGYSGNERADELCNKCLDEHMKEYNEKSVA